MDKRYIILGAALVLLIIFGTLLIINSRKSEIAELNFVTYSEDEKNFEEIFASFEQANNAKINFQKIESNYELESLNRISTGKIDVWGIPANWLPKQKDKLTTAPSTFADNYPSLYPETISQENSINNKVYGAPLALDNLVLFTNPFLKASTEDLTREQEELLGETPQNWEDFAAQARLITSKSRGQINISGAALGTSNLTAATDILTVMMLQFGTQMTNEDYTRATFHTNINKFGGQPYPGAAALEFYSSFATPGDPNYSFSESLGDPLRAFAEGKIAHYIDYSKKEADIKRINPDLNFQINPLPQVKETKNPLNFLSFETFTVPQTSKNQTMAWKLIEFMTDQINADQYYDVSNNHPALGYKIADESRVFIEAVETAGFWYNPDAIEVDKIFRSSINQTIEGKSSQTVLDGAALEVTNLLGKIQ